MEKGSLLRPKSLKYSMRLSCLYTCVMGEGDDAGSSLSPRFGVDRRTLGQWISPHETVTLRHCRIVQYRCQSSPGHERKPVTSARPMTRTRDVAGDRISTLAPSFLRFPYPTHLLPWASLAPYNPFFKPLYIAKTPTCQCLGPIRRNCHQFRRTFARAGRPRDSLPEKNVRHARGVAFAPCPC